MRSHSGHFFIFNTWFHFSNLYVITLLLSTSDGPQASKSSPQTSCLWHRPLVTVNSYNMYTAIHKAVCNTTAEAPWSPQTAAGNDNLLQLYRSAVSSRTTNWGRNGSCVCIECFRADKVYHIQLQSKMVKDKRLIKETADYNAPLIITKYFAIVFAGKRYKIK